MNSALAMLRRNNFLLMPEEMIHYSMSFVSLPLSGKKDHDWSARQIPHQIRSLQHRNHHPVFWAHRRLHRGGWAGGNCLERVARPARVSERCCCMSIVDKQGIHSWHARRSCQDTRTDRLEKFDNCRVDGQIPDSYTINFSPTALTRNRLPHFYKRSILYHSWMSWRFIACPLFSKLFLYLSNCLFITFRIFLCYIMSIVS